MKRFIIVVLFLCSTVFPQDIYYSIPTSSTIFHSQNGQAGINYNFYHSNSIIVHKYYSQLTYPDGSKSPWQTEYNGSGETGGWWVTKAGTYKIEGKAWVTSVLWGNSYWTFRPIFSFSVEDSVIRLQHHKAYQQVG